MNIAPAQTISAPYAGLSTSLERAQGLVESARTIAFGGLYNDISKSKFRQGADMAHEAALLIAQTNNHPALQQFADIVERGSHAMAVVADRDLGWTEAVGQAVSATKSFDRALEVFNNL